MSLEPEQYHVKAIALDFNRWRMLSARFANIQERYGAAGRAWIGQSRDYGMSPTIRLPAPEARVEAVAYLRRMAPTQSHRLRHFFHEVADWIDQERGAAATLERFKIDQLIALKLKPLDGLYYRTTSMSEDERPRWAEGKRCPNGCRPGSAVDPESEGVPSPCRICKGTAFGSGNWAIALDGRLWKWAGAWYPQWDDSPVPRVEVYVIHVYEPRSLDVPLQTHTPHMGHKPGANWAAVENCPSCATPGSE